MTLRALLEIGFLKWATVACVFSALFIVAWSQAADSGSFSYRQWNRYCAGLERKLRPMFIFIPARLIGIGQGVALVVFLAAEILFRIPYWGLGVVAILVGPAAYVEYLRRERILRIEAQLDGLLLALANALKTTPSIGAALTSVANVVTVPTKQEIELVVKEMKVGSSLDQALLHMGARSGSRKLDSALSSILIGRQVGGNLPKILETMSATMREMERLDGVVRARTAEGKFQIWAIAIMPFVVVFGFAKLWPGYLDPLTESLIGYILIGVAAVLWVAAIALARKILTVDI